MDPYWWVALGSIPGVGTTTYLKLLARFGSPEAVFRAPLRALQDVERVGPQVARAIREYRDSRRAERELKRLEAMGASVITLGQESYPPALAAIHDPPPYFFVKGKIQPEDRLAVAVVGARAASTYGMRVTHRIARELARQGITVISGMARGIDSEAHRGALAAGGRTIAVLGSGLNVIYPPENRELYERIAASGAVISEYFLDAEPEGGHFPARNRIISGMSLGVTIIEAAPKSGSLITAHLALEQGREVFAVPGSVDSIRSHGTHDLIREGAYLVESAQDILSELRPHLESWRETGAERDVLAKPFEPLSPEEEGLMALLGEEPVHIDELIREGGLSPSSVTAALLQLELKGCIRQLPGKRFVRLS